MIRRLVTYILEGCLGSLGVSCLSVLLAVFIIIALLVSLVSCAEQGIVGVVKGAVKGAVGVGAFVVEHTPFLVAVDAIALVSHLNGPSLQSYDSPSDPLLTKIFPPYWQAPCPNDPEKVCNYPNNGDLQCVGFVKGAFALAGIALPYAHDAHYFWPDYQDPKLRSTWKEIPAGTGPPELGDIVVWHSWHYDMTLKERVEDAGHVAIVAAVVLPKGNTSGKVYLAEANIKGADGLPTIREALTRDAGGALLKVLSPTTLNARVGEMMLYPDLSVQDDKDLENVYTHPQSSGSVVDGYIRYISPPASSAKGYTVTGPPSISADLINQVLAAYNSPAAGQGQALYDLGVQYGIDPVFALAFFMHESQFGTTGEARYTLSLGNERCIPDRPCIDQDRGGYAKMNSWQDGFEHWYQLIKNLYVGQWHLSTVEQIVPVYAPSSDNNNVAAYIQSVEQAVDAWRGGKVQV